MLADKGETSNHRIRALIVDDHPVVRFGLRHMLEAEGDIEVVGELEDIRTLTATLAKLKPDVVMLDLELGEADGVDALRIFHEAAPGVRVIIYTSHDEEDRIVEAAEIGVDGYLLKGCPREEIVSAIRSVFDGGTALEASVASKLMRRVSRRRGNQGPPEIQFSKREQQVLELLAQGKPNRAIGAALCISESTVKFHVHAILSKLGADNRTEAVSIAAQQGLIKLATSS